MSTELEKTRIEIMNRRLDKSTVAQDPMVQFNKWMNEARAAEIEQVNGMTLATSNKAGRPSARMVLLEGLDERGFVFYTSLVSRKASDLDENPWAALLFWWAPLYRQVRVDGQVTRLSAAECEAYFQDRPHEHKVESWASRQSQAIESRAALRNRFDEVEASFAGREITRPSDFGGYCLSPMTMDFWQARLDWLHDWIQYVRREGDRWQIRRLSP